MREPTTWVYNQLRFFKKTDVLILSSKLHADRVYFPLEHRKLISFPGHENLKNSFAPLYIVRGLSELILKFFRLDLLVFVWQMRKYDCSLVHAHFANTGWKFISVSKMLDIPLIVAFYGYDYDRLPNTKPLWKRRYRKLFKNVTLFLTEGEYGRKKLIEKGVSPNHIRVHHLGVDIDGIHFQPRTFSTGQALKLVQVARLEEKKGHQVLIEAMKLLINKHGIKNVSLTIIGEGPLKKDLVDLTQQYQLDTIINFIDHVPYVELHTELIKYHVFIHPSVTALDGDCEGGAPVVLLDAQATGMPVISTYHCDIPEEVIDGKTGLLVPENDPHALAAAIEEFIYLPDKIAQYGIAAREHVKIHYCAQKQAEKLENLYCEMVS
jgi:colanic acid/amylovoran biosynthesis glycosyltransferase